MNFEEAAKLAAQSTGGGKFVGLKNDGDNVIGFFRGEPEARTTYFNTATNKSEPYTAAHEAAGEKKSTKFLMNMFVIEEKKAKMAKMKIVTLTPDALIDFIKAKQKFDAQVYAFEVSRKGAKGDTNTKYTILPDIDVSKISPETKAALDAAPLFDLVKEAQGTGEDDDSTDMNSHGKTNGHAVISAEESGALTGRLKALPRSVVDAFLAKFSVTKVKDLPAAKYAEASAFVGSHEPKAAPAAAAEVDPFS